MTHKPGQGFRLGEPIKIKAIPFPLPELVAGDLIAAGNRVRSARLSVELIKEGSTPQKDAAADKYEQAVADLNMTEAVIRHAHGVDYVRDEYLPRGNK